MADPSATTFNYAALDGLRKTHPAWRLLRADSTALMPMPVHLPSKHPPIPTIASKNAHL